MVMPDSFMVNGGLAPICDFSVDNARAEFKDTWDWSVKHFISISDRFDTADELTDGKVNTKKFAKTMSMAIYVESLLCTLVAQTREINRRIEEAKDKGDLKRAQDLEHDLVYGLVPYVRSLLVTAMTNICPDDINDIRSAWDCLIPAEQARRVTAA